VGVVQTVAGQALALAKAPLNVVRGSGGEEKVLKNAKDACASEALEIPTYTSFAPLARAAREPGVSPVRAWVVTPGCVAPAGDVRR
jgi:hypothetical protein